MTDALAEEIRERLDEFCPEEIPYESINLLNMRDGELPIDDETVAVIGMPVYVGKVPLPAIAAMKKIAASGAMAITAVSYGARSYGNALYELQHYVENQGFKVIGAGAFAVKYKNSGLINRIRENAIDKAHIDEFAVAASEKIKRLAGCEIEGLKIKPAPLEVSGKLPLHGISRISPRAAAIAQEFIERINILHSESEWYL